MTTATDSPDTAEAKGYLDSLPVFSQFEGVADGGNYRALPDGWALAAADIVSSTAAIASGRYKAVNMAGASVISAILNGLGQRDLPFVFGGDGAFVAVPPGAIDRTRQALAAVKTWTAEELELDLRAAVVPIEAIRAAGLDVRIARFEVGPEVSYAMFTGGGTSWAEAEMKAGRFGIDAAPAGTRPDLTGLSCRWNPIAASRGEIVSIIVVPGETGNDENFRRLVSDVIALAGDDRGGHPVPAAGPEYGLLTKGMDYEARAAAPAGKRLGPRLRIMMEVAVSYLFFKLGRTIAGFDPAKYRSEVARNSDFRKFDDGLKMTVDVDAGRLRRIEQRLEAAAAAGHCRYGLHRQESALMTCFVPSPLAHDHIHFIDGAAGGYAVAAQNLKDGRAPSRAYPAPNPDRPEEPPPMSSGG